MPQFVGQCDKSSTKENPYPLIWISKAFFKPFLAFNIFAGVSNANLAIYTGASNCANISHIVMGYPSVFGFLPRGAVVAFCPISVVGAICPPVIPNVPLLTY